MQAWLYLTTVKADDNSPVIWWQTDGEPVHGTLQQAVVLAGRRLTLLLPAEIVSHHRFDVPPRSGRWLQQAIHSVLEERLLDDPSSCIWPVDRCRRVGTAACSPCNASGWNNYWNGWPAMA
ncbi:hypothetical protein C4K18_5011 [Pseudomonas chlororaphis subsp. aurantiaca]|nr:hypothetical protein C4K18_5011 [Pseudomonas chlororaphis subsp. aurantiaca]